MFNDKIFFSWTLGEDFFILIDDSAEDESWIVKFSCIHFQNICKLYIALNKHKTEGNIQNTMLVYLWQKQMTSKLYVCHIKKKYEFKTKKIIILKMIFYFSYILQHSIPWNSKLMHFISFKLYRIFLNFFK